MGVRTARGVRRIGATAAALAGALVLTVSTVSPAHAETRTETPVAATDRLMFAESLRGFVDTRRSPDRPTGVDWTSDGCSLVTDAPLGYDFLQACWRHDFGYRNYKAQGRFTEKARVRIDDRFRADMSTLCGRGPLCIAAADLYYLGVRKLGA